MVVFHQEDRILIASGTSLRHQMQDNLPQILRQDRKPARQKQE